MENQQKSNRMNNVIFLVMIAFAAFLSIHQSTHLSTYLYIILSMSINLSIHLSIYLSIYPVNLSIYLYINLTIYLNNCHASLKMFPNMKIIFISIMIVQYLVKLLICSNAIYDHNNKKQYSRIQV